MVHERAGSQGSGQARRIGGAARATLADDPVLYLHHLTALCHGPGSVGIQCFRTFSTRMKIVRTVDVKAPPPMQLFRKDATHYRAERRRNSPYGANNSQIKGSVPIARFVSLHAGNAYGMLYRYTYQVVHTSALDPNLKRLHEMRPEATALWQFYKKIQVHTLWKRGRQRTRARAQLHRPLQDLGLRGQKLAKLRYCSPRRECCHRGKWCWR